MNNITNIEDRKQHTVSEVICIKCGNRWIACRPTVALLKDMQCPCGEKGWVIETGQYIEDERLI